MIIIYILYNIILLSLFSLLKLYGGKIRILILFHIIEWLIEDDIGDATVCCTTTRYTNPDHSINSGSIF